MRRHPLLSAHPPPNASPVHTEALCERVGDREVKRERGSDTHYPHLFCCCRLESVDLSHKVLWCLLLVRLGADQAIPTARHMNFQHQL